MFRKRPDPVSLKRKMERHWPKNDPRNLLSQN